MKEDGSRNNCGVACGCVGGGSDVKEDGADVRGVKTEVEYATPEVLRASIGRGS